MRLSVNVQVRIKCLGLICNYRIKLAHIVNMQYSDDSGMLGLEQVFLPSISVSCVELGTRKTLQFTSYVQTSYLA